MKSGAFEYLLKPINFDELKLAIWRAVEVGRLRSEVEEIKSGFMSRYSYDSLIGESKQISENAGVHPPHITRDRLRDLAARRERSWKIWLPGLFTT